MGRAISKPFLNELLSGSLRMLVDAVKNDNSLIMELRGDSVKIYYRGRLLITVQENKNSYCIHCNSSYWAKYNEFWKQYNKSPEQIKEPSVQECVYLMPCYKAPVDYYLSNVKSYLEEQCKQQLVIENNVFGKNTDKTGDYFILDTEYSINDEDIIRARFDGIALRWPSTPSSRKNGNNLGISFLELKYNDASKKGSAGIKKHIDDYINFVKTREYHDMCRDMEMVFYQKCKLGLIPSYNQSNQIKLDQINIKDDDSDLVFVFINSDPDNVGVNDEWNIIEKSYEIKELNRIYVAQSSCIGYGLFRYDNYGTIDRYSRISEFFE